MSTINLTGRISLNATQLRDRITVLGEQISTGRRGRTYAAIGTDAPKTIDLRAEIGRRETYQTTINQTLSKVMVSQDVLDRIGAIAQKFTANTVRLLGAARPEEIQIQAAQAEAAMVEVATLLNEQLNGEYLFGGSDSRNPPIPNPQEIATKLGGMGREIKNKVASLNGSNVDDVLDDTKSLAESDAADTTPFSYFLSARTWTGSTPYAVGDVVVSNGNIYRATLAGTSNATGGPTGDGTGIIDSGARWDYVQPGTVAGATEARTNILGNDNDRVAYGIHANRNAAIVSTGETTGSWARDLLRGLASIAGLTPDKAQLGNDYTTFVTTLRNGLESAVDALALERGSLGLTEARLQSMASHHESVSTSLTLQLSNLEEVDMAKTITSFQTTQSQLEASYRALAISQQLSLTRFL
jgi:flagellin-like hook-associated protein FlgL